MVKKKANTRHRMSKLEKFYIDHHMDSDAKSLAIELGIPEAVIDRYQKKVKRGNKKESNQPWYALGSNKRYCFNARRK